MLIAILALMVVTAISIGLMWTGRSELHVAGSYRDISLARTAADSGMQYFVLLMDNCRSDRMHVDETPDMFDVVHDHLTESLPSSPPTMTGTGLDRVITLPFIAMNATSSFSMELSAVPGMVDPDSNLPTQMKLVVTGRHGDLERKVWAHFNVQPNNDILNHSIASMIRVIVRGNNTIINGDIISSWERAVYESYPFDVGNSISSYRDLENIQFNHMKGDGTIVINGGKLGTSLSRGQFDGEDDLPNGWGRKNCNNGLRHANHQAQVSCGKNDSDRFDMTYEDFDTSKYRDRAEVNGSTPSTIAQFNAILQGEISDEQKVTLPYPDFNEPEYARKGQAGHYRWVYRDGGWTQIWTPATGDAWRFREPDGDYAYGYPSGGNWIVYNNNNLADPANGQWEFGYYTGTVDAPVWNKVNRNPQTDAPIGRYSDHGDWVYMGDARVTIPPNPDADAHLIYEAWSSSLNLWRAYYRDYNGTDNPKFKNLHIPMGSHAHFKNCTFTGITYVETDETTDLGQGSGTGYNQYNRLRRNCSVGDGAGSNRTLACNNVVFEDCTFEGPIISGVPKDLRFMDNAVQFIGKTVFDASAIREELQGTTIMMPNYNVNIGDFDQTTTGCESEIVGILVGGIVDIRDNAVINGTLINMTSLDHLSNDQVSGGWGSNIGNYEGSTSETYVAYNTFVIDESGDINEPRDSAIDFAPAPTPSFSPSENIVITPDPDNVIPYGMRVRYALVLKPESFGEGGD